MIDLGAAGVFRIDSDWEQLPPGFRHLDVPDIAIGPNDDVYVLTRQQPRVLVYDADGRFERSFGESLLSDKPHGIAVAPDGTVYCVDSPAHAVWIFDPKGRHVATLGTRDFPSATGYDGTIEDPYVRAESIAHAAGPFNEPAGVAIAPNGDVYIADGYGNARIHRFDADGRLITSWGAPGGEAGEFHLPHALVVLQDGRVVVCDRENDRLQVFTANGGFLAEWPDLQRPAGVAVGPDGLVYVAELTRGASERSFATALPDRLLAGRVCVLRDTGELVGRFTTTGDPCAPDQLSDPHGIAVDSQGNVYVAEVSFTGLGVTTCHTLQRLARV